MFRGGVVRLEIICPTCKARLVWDEKTVPPDRIVACPNRRRGCGQGPWRTHGFNWFPQMLQVRHYRGEK